MKDIVLVLIIATVTLIGFNSYAQVVAIDKNHVRITKTITQDVTVSQLQMQCSMAQKELVNIQNIINTICPLVNQAIDAEEKVK